MVSINMLTENSHVYETLPLQIHIQLKKIILCIENQLLLIIFQILSGFFYLITVSTLREKGTTT